MFLMKMSAFDIEVFFFLTNTLVPLKETLMLAINIIV